ncbi:glycosyltransferase family 39 protein [Streptomyces sp. FXJ1.172]|uniref:glycosyltransferase family 39 protein n=1 Tax=Streptomyces sp. FXJ1.172 TaxID=710705 RepID=UPI0007CF5CF0|nr:glycosyltransferase family 39 protein [Streptomyces sp. FXJ1.172]WEO97281.1 glycosyltransferase family 39 protein [Streptomyces sp. FXJ1.172]
MTSATDPIPHAPTTTPGPPSPTPTPTPAAEPERAPRWSLPVLLAVMLLAAVLYTWNLSGSNLNSFYSAAIYSGTQNWKAWFFGSLDAGNFLTVDKPPFADMVMSLSCRIFGFGTWQMMLPEVAAGLGAIWILHSSVKRSFGHAAAAVAALVLALTPITVAINRDNNPDTILVLLMVGGAALALRATRTGRLLPLLGSAVCFGLAFNTKMLAGYIALPAVFAVHLFAARPKLVRRIVNLLIAGVVLAVSSFWWAIAVSLVPASERPYIGGSTDGTAWNLIMGYNGLGRIFGGEGNGGGGGGGGGGGFSGSAGLGRMFNDILGGQISWLIPFSVIALVAGLILCGRAPRTDLTRAALILWGGWTVLHYVTFATAEGTMHPYYTTALAPGIAALCGGGGVLLLRAFRADKRWAWVLPAALAVTAVWAIVLLRRASGWHTWLWPTVGVVMAAAVVGLFVFRSGARARLLAASVAAAVVAALAGPAAYAWSLPSGSGGGGMGGVNPTAGPSTGNGFGGGMGGGRGGFPGGGEMPGGGRNAEAGGGFPGGGTAPGGSATGMPQGGASAGELPGGGRQAGGFPGGGQSGELPGGQGVSGGTGAAGGEPGRTGSGRTGTGMGGGPGGMGGANSGLIAYLKKHQDGATWLLAVSNSQSAAQIELSAKVPVISMWGFTGTDKAMTVAKLEELVKKGELHYIQIGGGMMGGGPGGDSNSVSSEVTAWVKKHGTLVKESAYSKSSTSSPSKASSPSSASTNQSAIYRLDPSDVS